MAIRFSTVSAAVALALGATAAHATDVNFTLDWAFQGPQAPYLLAVERGYFEDEGINITMDRGYGSGDVPVKILSGTYDIGVADINPSIKLLAEQEDADLIAVAVISDGSPLAAMTLVGNGIETPADLEGKVLAAPDFDAGRQLFPAFAMATGIDQDTIEWMSVSPQLRETMLATGEADAITGFLTSGVFSLQAAGVAEEDIITMRYPEFGVDLYSTSVITTRAFAEENPEVVTRVIRAIMRGHMDALADPEAAIQALINRDPLIDPELEMARLLLHFDELVLTDNVIENGMSYVEADRLAAAIEMVKASYGIERDLPNEMVYTDAYLPPREELMVPAETVAMYD